jgi:hypothetical protein
MLKSDTIFSEELPLSRSPSNESNFRGFEETIELYESAIEGAREHGFMQYKAIGKFKFF